MQDQQELACRWYDLKSNVTTVLMPTNLCGEEMAEAARDVHLS